MGLPDDIDAFLQDLAPAVNGPKVAVPQFHQWQPGRDRGPIDTEPAKERREIAAGISGQSVGVGAG
jgi:hypothetical protein